MKLLVSVLFISLSLFGYATVKSPKIKAEDLKQLTGAQWKGTLTYLDYSKNKKVSIPSNLTVTQSAKDKLALTFDYQYPDEPKANSIKTVTIGKDGKTLSDETVVERAKLDKTLKIVTEKLGKDDDRPARFRFTYLLGANSFSIKKEVKLDSAPEFFLRNEYSWKR